MMSKWEPFFAERFGGCIVVSESDRRILLSMNPHLRIDVIPNGVDTNLYQPLAHSSISPALVFVGNMGYRPNIDAMNYFCRAIYPQIRREVADLEMWIVGINPSPEVKQLEGNGVHVTGPVNDVRPFYSRSTVCVIPLRAGGGTRLKILEAMAVGRPIVSTSIGCEGLEVVDGEHLFIADTPQQFVERTIALLRDEGLRQRISTQARKLVVTQYDWELITQRALQVYSRIARRAAT
jgi:glycosyltransferase involved in cell wall biosynthesis